MPSPILEVGARVVRAAGFDGAVREIEVPLSISRAGGTETLFERLNTPGLRFLPCRSEGSSLHLNLEWLAWIEAPISEEEVAFHVGAGAARAPVVLEMVAGEALAGELLYLPGRHQDDLGVALDGEQPFLLLVEEECLRFVNRRAVARVRSA